MLPWMTVVPPPVPPEQLAWVPPIARHLFPKMPGIGNSDEFAATRAWTRHVPRTTPSGERASPFAVTQRMDNCRLAVPSDASGLPVQVSLTIDPLTVVPMTGVIQNVQRVLP